MVASSTDRFNGVIAAQAIKTPCKAVAIANITLSGEQTVNSVAVVADDRVLATAQTDPIENGIYDVSTGAWARSADWDGNRDVVSGTFVTVATATVGRNPYYQVTTADPIIVGTTAVNFTLADGPNVSYPITADEITAGKTTSDIDDAFPELHVLRYGSALNATTLQAAIDYWIAKGSGTLDLAGQIFDTGSTEITINWISQNIVPMVLEANGAVIAPSATIDSGNGYGLKIIAESVLVRNKVYQNLKVKPSSGDCGGIEFDGTGASGGQLYRQTCNNISVESVTKHGWFLSGTIFESHWRDCNVDIVTNESGQHCVFVNEDGNDASAGDGSSLYWSGGTLSGGENNVRIDGAGDSFRIDKATLLLAGKEAYLGSSSGNLEQSVTACHVEACWSGASAIASASWVNTTSQSGIAMIGRGAIRDCYFVSTIDTLRSFTRVSSVGEVELSNLFGVTAECQYVCEAEGAAGTKITAISCEIGGVGAVAVFDTHAAANVSYQAIGCAHGGDHSSIKTFDSADATPSVSAGNNFFSNSTGVTITQFDDGIAGQAMDIISKGATVYDTSTATRLVGSSVDITTASGDVTTWLCEVGGTSSSVWRLKGFVDVSVDNSAGA